MKKTLCLYYSRTNTTREAMERLAELVDADLYEYTDGKNRSGKLGYIGCCLASFRKYIDVRITGEPDMSLYDRVIIGMPIWAEGPSIMGRSLLKKYGSKLPGAVWYVVTQMGTSDYTKKIYALDEYIGHPAEGHLSLRTKDNDYLGEIAEFAEKLRAAE